MKVYHTFTRDLQRRETFEQSPGLRAWRWAPDGQEVCGVEIDIDLDELVLTICAAAVHNKTGKSVAFNNTIKARVLSRRKA